MLTFRELREKKLKGMPPGQHVWDKKIKGVIYDTQRKRQIRTLY